MSFFRNFGIGVGAYGRALSLIFRHQLYWAFLFPIIINIALLIGGFSAMGSVAGWLQSVVESLIRYDQLDFWMQQHLPTILYWLIAIIVKLAFFLVFLYYSGFLVLIVMSPVLAYLSERTEQILTGKTFPFSLTQLLSDILRSILINLRNILYQLGINILLFIASFIPVLGWLSPLAMFLMSCYFYGFSNLDYNNERHKLKVKESIHFVRKNYALAIGNGFPFALSLFIPICGFFLSCFVAVIGVVAATIVYADLHGVSERTLNKPKQD